jgi:5-methylcytosine-specific restriction protein A
MKLRILKTGVRMAGQRSLTPVPDRPEAVERKRGRAGVEDRERIRARDEGQCQQCKREQRAHINIGTDVDHIVPLWEGGSDEDENKELLCLGHHLAKSNREAKRRAAR